MAMKEEQKKKLWDAYKKNKTPEIREQLIIEYANLVNLVAGRMGMYLGYTVEYDDLVGYGIFGLIDAIDKFDLTKNELLLAALLKVGFSNKQLMIVFDCEMKSIYKNRQRLKADLGLTKNDSLEQMVMMY